MALSDLDRESRTRREDAPSHYQVYLNSATWRSTRNQKLRECRWTCERCGARRDLNVHHKTYERLGLERMTDLEVLCFTCHNGHHKREAQHDELGIYLKIVSSVLDRNALMQIADIADEVKTICAQKKIAQKVHLIDKAISMACGTRLKDGDRPYRSVVDIDRSQSADTPITHAQSVEFLMRLGLGREEQSAIVKPMPKARLVTQHYVDKMRAFALITQAIEDSIARCEELEQQA